jgi:4-amino-4-deoxy-L-arabinose transferase-like glycosyltransferase
MTLSQNSKILLLLFCGAVLALSQGLNFHGPEYRDDEVFYFKSTQEMVKTGDVLSPKFLGENRFQKPILFYWLILGSYKIFGMNWAAARMVSVIFGALCVLMTWILAKEFFDEKTATLSALILLATALFFNMAKAAVPDMAMNFFIILAIYNALKFIQNPALQKHLTLFFISCALGFMLKGFSAIVVPSLVLVIYAHFIRREEILKKLNLPWGYLVMMAIILPWFVYMIGRYGESYTQYVWINETKDRIISPAPVNFFVKVGSSLIRNTIVYLRFLVIDFFPWSIFMVGAIPWAVQNIKQAEDRKSLGLMLVWFFVVLGFLIPLFVTINHYLLILSTPLAILISAWITRRRIRGVAFLALAIVVILALQTPLLAKSGLCSNIPLERLAKIVKADCQGNCSIGVVNHNSRDNEWQIYFDQKIEKLGSESPALTSALIEQFLRRKEPQLYCLVPLKDYEAYHEKFGDFKVIAQDEIVRKPISWPDLEKEKIILLRKGE